MHGHQGKGVQGPGREGGGSVPGSCRGWGSPFFKPPLPFAFQAPADREQQSEGRGFLPQLHPAPEGCGEAQDQQRYGNRSLLSGGPCPMLGDCGLVKKRSPQGCSEELPPFPVTEGHPGKLLKRREGLPLPVLPSWGSRQQDVEKKPSVIVYPLRPGGSRRKKEAGRQEPAPPARPTSALPSSEACKRALQGVWELSEQWDEAEHLRSRSRDRVQKAQAEWATWEAWSAGEHRQPPKV
ncbi:uncharacterized protein [Haliaeetus albicilla]|uniref:uncharacterized protein n=1 Tax=Haliaeetus albicilla TaxID=8969 RepID=UPI0037E9601E